MTLYCFVHGIKTTIKSPQTKVFKCLYLRSSRRFTRIVVVDEQLSSNRAIGCNVLRSSARIAAAFRSDSSGGQVNQTKLAVRAGSIYLSSVDSSLQVSSISFVAVNPEFSANSWHGDVALVRLSNPLQLTPDVHPICLPSGIVSDTDIATKYSVCVVAGWTPTRSTVSS